MARPRSSSEAHRRQLQVADTGYCGTTLTAFAFASITSLVPASGVGMDIPCHERAEAEEDGVLSQLSVNARARENFLRLSYGQRRRVLLARAIVHSPQVLLLDGLDYEALNRMQAYLSELTCAGISSSS